MDSPSRSQQGEAGPATSPSPISHFCLRRVPLPSVDRRRCRTRQLDSLHVRAIIGRMPRREAHPPLIARVERHADVGGQAGREEGEREHDPGRELADVVECLDALRRRPYPYLLRFRRARKPPRRSLRVRGRRPEPGGVPPAPAHPITGLRRPPGSRTLVPLTPFRRERAHALS